MAANRYTRIANLSGVAHDEAAELLDTLHDGALQRVEAAPASARKAAAQAAREAESGITSHNIAAYRALLDTIGALVAAGGNALYADNERAVRGRVFSAPPLKTRTSTGCVQRKRQRLSLRPDPQVPRS